MSDRVALAYSAPPAARSVRARRRHAPVDPQAFEFGEEEIEEGAFSVQHRLRGHRFVLVVRPCRFPPVFSVLDAFARFSAVLRIHNSTYLVPVPHQWLEVTVWQHGKQVGSHEVRPLEWVSTRLLEKVGGSEEQDGWWEGFASFSIPTAAMVPDTYNFTFDVDSTEISLVDGVSVWSASSLASCSWACRCAFCRMPLALAA